jgi:hypothetical protein
VRFIVVFLRAQKRFVWLIAFCYDQQTEDEILSRFFRLNQTLAAAEAAQKSK